MTLTELGEQMGMDMSASYTRDQLWSLTNDLEGMVTQSAELDVAGNLVVLLTQLVTETIETCKECPDCESIVDVDTDTVVTEEYATLRLTLNLQKMEWL